MRLAAGLCPDRLGSLQCSPRPPSWILGVDVGKGREGKGGGEREERKGSREKGNEGEGRDHPQ